MANLPFVCRSCIFCYLFSWFFHVAMISCIIDVGESLNWRTKVKFPLNAKNDSLCCNEMKKKNKHEKRQFFTAIYKSWYIFKWITINFARKRISSKIAEWNIRSARLMKALVLKSECEGLNKTIKLFRKKRSFAEEQYCFYFSEIRVISLAVSHFAETVRFLSHTFNWMRDETHTR